MKRYEYQQLAITNLQSKQRRMPWIMTGVATVAMLFSVAEGQLQPRSVVASQQITPNKDKSSEMKTITGQYRITNTKGMAMLVPVMVGSQQTIAAISGYTPMLSDGRALTLLAAGDPSRGYQLPIPSTDTQTLDIHYHADPQSANVDLVDCEGQPIANVDGALGYTINGQTDEKIDFSTVKRQVSGYRIVQDETLPKAHYDGNHSQTFRIFYVKSSSALINQATSPAKIEASVSDTVAPSSRLEEGGSDTSVVTDESNMSRMARYGHQDEETEVQRSGQGWFATLISVVLGWFGFGRRRKAANE